MAGGIAAPTWSESPFCLFGLPFLYSPVRRSPTFVFDPVRGTWIGGMKNDICNSEALNGGYVPPANFANALTLDAITLSRLLVC